MFDPPHIAPPPDATSLIADAVEAIGQPAFLPALARLCETASGHTSTFIMACCPDAPPLQVYDNLAPDEIGNTVTPYLDFAYLLDPFYTLFTRGIGDAVVSLSDCAPDDFKRSDYFRTFYADTGLFDETSLFVSFPNGYALMLSLGSRDRGFALPPEGRAALENLLPVICALCRRHWPKFEACSPPRGGRWGLHLEKAFDLFGSSVLSTRETEITHLILRGHSSKSIARELGNSPETVKVHRKRIYAKLDIASQGELFAMFLDALGRTPPNAHTDPLTYLDRRAAARDIG